MIIRYNDNNSYFTYQCVVAPTNVLHPIFWLQNKYLTIAYFSRIFHGRFSYIYIFFNIINNFLLTVCGGTYYAPLSADTSGTIISPGYPGNYGNNLLCNYTIEVDPEDFIMLQFDDDAFYIEGLRKALVANPQHSDNVTSVNGTASDEGKVGLITDSSGKFIWIWIFEWAKRILALDVPEPSLRLPLYSLFPPVWILL